ncbi:MULTISPECIES: pitrilysin family protein [Exiguobacterium]|uniref:M16 family metallopeptidase n=1 Tax=Exiguobacterium TaxID=33986 RepID=UPI00047B0103|nr:MULTISPECIES: pitrilysin family protein [Exiguobacterium]MCK2156949.1 insulinase family protein [Exiguobacterium sp. 17-1]
MVERLVLENGVRIVSERIENARSVATGIFIKAGSRTETKEEHGISHLIEHMMFKGTKKQSAKEIAVYFDRLGGNINAFTSKDQTCYYVKTLDEHAITAFDVLADMFLESTFDEEELEKEKRVVIEEIKMYEDTPDDLVHELLAVAAYGEDVMARPILGTEESVKQLSRQMIVEYLQEAYAPEQIVISVAGHVTDELITQIKNRFSVLQTNGTVRQIEEPVLKSDSLRKEKDTEQVHVCYNFRAIPSADDRLPTLALLNNAFGATMSSRLFQSIREDRGLAYSVFSYYTTFDDHGTFTIYVGTSKETLEEVETVLSTEIQQLLEHGLTTKELEDGIEQLKGSLILGNESTSSHMNRNARNELHLGMHPTLEDVLAEVEQITPANVQEMIAYIFSEPPAKAYILPEIDEADLETE